MEPADKTDIVLALRKVAAAVEHGASNHLDLLQAIGTEMLVLALKNGPRSLTDADETERLARRELAAVADNIARFHEHRATEVEILNARLVRQFDPAMAWNEAINRAIVAKKAAREEVVLLTPTQQMMFDRFQVPATMKALASA